MKKMVLVFLCVVLAGCALSLPNYIVNPTPDESLYMEKVRAQPLEFDITEAEGSIVWGRAQSFIGQYSSMKLQIVTDYVIQTYNPTDDPYKRKFGYYITKTPMGNNIKISVQCLGNHPYGLDGKPFPTIDLNARILSHYLKTGELPYPHLIDK